MEESSFVDAQNVGTFGEKKIKISIDLVQQTFKQLLVLQDIEKHPNLFKEEVVKNSIRRYEDLWLPLAMDNIETYIVPPLDIYLVWQCHMLAPVDYVKDCQRLIGTVPDHRFMTEKQYATKLQDTKALWEVKYPNEQFEVDIDKDDLEFQDRFHGKCRYNLEAAISRQQQFYYQVSLPHYNDVKFLQNAVSRYKKFLFLKKKHPSQFLVPCYDVDLIWHTHQLHPLMYKVDTETVLGKMLNHDDSVNDRSAGAKLDQSNMVTRQLWKETFGEDFAISGGMYRDKPLVYSDKSLHKFSEEEIVGTATKRAHVRLEVNRLDPTDKSLQLMVYLQHKTGLCCKVLTCKNPFNWRDTNTTNLDICTSKHSDLIFTVYECSGKSCRSVEIFSGKGLFPLGHNMEYKKTSRYEETVFTSGNHQGLIPYVPEIKITATMSNQKRGPTLLYLKPDEFKTSSENIFSMWGPLHLQNVSGDVSLNYCVANHVLSNHLHNDQFICRVVHSIPLMMSGVQVLVGEKMVASSHLIGSDQLPSPEQIHPFSKSPSLNAKQGERAMLLKDHLGDWAIITGQWLDFKHGIPERQGGAFADDVPAVPGNPGYFLVKYFNLRSRAVIQRTLYKDKSFTCHLGDVVFDMESGDIQIDAETDDIVQNICLAFSVAVLQALCQPHLVRNQPGTSRSKRNPYPSYHSVKPIKRIEVEKLALVMAGGYMQEIPSNSYMRSTGSVGGGSTGCSDRGDPGGCGGCGSSSECGGGFDYDSD